MRGSYNVFSQIKLKTTISCSSLCNYSDASIWLQRNVTITGVDDDNTNALAQAGQNIAFIFINCVYPTDYMTTVHNTKINNTKKIWWYDCNV